MIFIKDIMNSSSPKWVDKIEAYIPKWIESLVPYYNAAKNAGADIFRLSNVIYTRDFPTEYVENGIYYYVRDLNLTDKEMEINGSKNSFPCDILTSFRKNHELPICDEDCRDWSDWSMTRWSLHWHLTRYDKKEDKYKELAKRMDQYFVNLVDDPLVKLDVGDTTFILMDKRKDWKITEW